MFTNSVKFTMQPGGRVPRATAAAQSRALDQLVGEYAQRLSQLSEANRLLLMDNLTNEMARVVHDRLADQVVREVKPAVEQEEREALRNDPGVRAAALEAAKSELRAKAIEDLYNEHTPAVKNELRGRLFSLVESELRQDLTLKLTAQLEKDPAVRATVEDKHRKTVAPKVEKELRAELQAKVEKELRAELQAKVEKELRAELQAKVEREVRAAPLLPSTATTSANAPAFGPSKHHDKFVITNDMTKGALMRGIFAKKSASSEAGSDQS